MSNQITNLISEIQKEKMSLSIFFKNLESLQNVSLKISMHLRIMIENKYLIQFSSLSFGIVRFFINKKKKYYLYLVFIKVEFIFYLKI